MKANTFTAFFLLILPWTTYSQESKSVEETRGLQLGDSVVMFTARDQFGSTFILSEALEKGSVVLIFYRGEWCPFCDRHLSKIQDSLSYILEKGAIVVAVSPENQEHLKQTVDKTGASFTLLHDANYAICTSFDVLFEPTQGEVTRYNTLLSADLGNAHSNEEVKLPVPATFVISQNGVVVWRQFDHDYKNRSSVREIINHL